MKNVSTLAEELSVSENTLARWRLEGKGPIFVKAGHRVLYDPKDVSAWLEASKRNSTSEVRHG